MKESFFEVIKQLLEIGQETIKNNPLLDQETGKINVKGDKTLAMDKAVEDVLIDYIRKRNLPVTIFSEEIGVLNYHPDPTHLIVFDPLDGSTNYKIGKNLLPNGLMICCFNGIYPKLADIVAAGAIEHTTGLGWLYNGKTTTNLKGKPVTLKKIWEVHRSTPVYFDLYYKKAYDCFSPLAEKIHIRWSGSNIGSLTYVLSEVSAALGALLMRPEEIGTVTALIHGAGGIVVDHCGNDIRSKNFSFNKTYDILAGNTSIVKYSVSHLKNRKK